MGLPTYKVKVPQLVSLLKDQGKLVLFEDKEVPAARFILQYADLAMGTAYKATNPEKADKVELHTCWKIYRGLRGAEIKVDFGEGERNIVWSDIVEIIDE